MKVPDGLVEKACSDDEERPVLMQPWLRDGRILATDAHIAVSIPVVTDDDDTDGYVPVASLKGARKGGKRASRVVSLNSSAVTETPEGKLDTPRPSFLPEPPDVPALMPTKRDGLVVNINAAHLHRLAAALGSDKVTLTIGDEKGEFTPIIVEPYDKMDDRVGLLMRLREMSA